MSIGKGHVCTQGCGPTRRTLLIAGGLAAGATLAGCETGAQPIVLQQAVTAPGPKRGPLVNAHMHLQTTDWFSGNVFEQRDRGPRKRRAPGPAAIPGAGTSAIQDAAQARRSYPPSLEGQTQRILDEMGAAGIDTAILQAMDYDYTGAKLRVDHAKQIEQLAAVRDKHPGRFILFAAIDPRRGKAGVEMLRRFHNEFRISGMGEFAPHFFGFAPNDRERCYPVYEACAELDLPIAPNCSIVKNSISRFCDPIYFEDVAIDFPTINVQLTSAGAPHWTETAMALCQSKVNVFMDIGDWQSRFHADQIGHVLRFVHRALNTDARHKILFGSDYPVYARSASEKAWVEVFTVEARKHGVDFSDEDLHLFFSDNAQEFLDADLSMPAGSSL